MGGAEPTVRPFRDEDAPVAAAVLRAAAPEFLLTAELLLHQAHATPARAQHRLWVAERDGEVVGLAEAGLRWRTADPLIAKAWVSVAERDRRRGIGSRLYEVAEEHLRGLGAHTIRDDTVGEEGLAFAHAHGFEPARREQTWELDVGAADLSLLPELERRQAQEGFHVVPLAALLDRLDDLRALYEAAENDAPADDEPAPLDRAEWERETIGNPLLDPDASMTVLQGERPVAFAWLLTDREGGRGEHELTGTVHDLRGRGLATLAKLAAIRWCAENGIRVLLTSNDAANAPMLAINRRLGYRPGRVWTEVRKRL